MVHKYYLEIWRDLKPGEAKKFPEQTAKVETIKTFRNLIDAWKYVLAEHIEHYTVYGGECLIDQS